MLHRIKDMLKSAFTAKPAGEKVEKVPADALSGWLEAKSAALRKASTAEAGAFSSRIKEMVAEIRDKAEVLHNAKLRNPSIPPRALQLMEGNRTNYLSSILVFTRRAEEAIVEEDAAQALGSALDVLGQSTARSFAVLQEFFREESGDIALSLKEFASVLDGIKSSKCSADSRLLKKAEAAARIFLEKSKSAAAIESEIKELTRKHGEAGKAFMAARKEMNAFRESDAYKSYSSLKARADGCEASIKALDSDLRSSFSAVEKALRKFEHVSYDKEALIDGYLEDPLAQLAVDFELKIVPLLRDLKSSLGAIKLDEKRAGKAEDALVRMDANYFSRILSEYNGLIRERRAVEAGIADSGAGLKEEKLALECGMREREISLIEKEAEAKRAEDAALAIEAAKAAAEEKMGLATGLRVLIS